MMPHGHRQALMPSNPNHLAVSMRMRRVDSRHAKWRIKEAAKHI